MKNFLKTFRNLFATPIVRIDLFCFVEIILMNNKFKKFKKFKNNF